MSTSVPMVTFENPGLTVRMIRDFGYAVVENVVSRDTVKDAKTAITGESKFFGRNQFEGVKTKRIYSFVAKTRVLDGFFADPNLVAILQKLLGDYPLLSRTQAISIFPGEVHQALHRDDICYPLSKPRPTCGISIMLAIDDFTDSNGATRVIPKSHLFKDDEAFAKPEISVNMPAGSALIFLSELIHGGGANFTETARIGVFAHYCLPWLRQLDNPFLSFDRAKLTDVPDELKSLLGYSTHEENGIYFGVVDGRHPLKVITTAS